MQFPSIEIPVQKIFTQNSVALFLKREDLIHPDISGNKYWKLFYNINHYLAENPAAPLIITFGGAFSNHISAVAALGKSEGIPTLGIIRGDELKDNWQENSTLKKAFENGMVFRFVTRESYRNKAALTNTLQTEFPNALIIPEGGTNAYAVWGIQHMLSEGTKEFDYLCTAVGTGGTAAGLSKFAKENQSVLGFKIVKDNSLEDSILNLSRRKNFKLIEADFGGYGKINAEIVGFINEFYNAYKIPLDPVYTGKMMFKLINMIKSGYFAEGTKILAMHTGGLQGIAGANDFLKSKNRELINF